MKKSDPLAGAGYQTHFRVPSIPIGQPGCLIHSPLGVVKTHGKVRARFVTPIAPGLGRPETSGI
jgi:hypothetical protein